MSPRLAQAPRLAEAEITREARRVFRKLNAPGAHLSERRDGTWSIVCPGANRAACADVSAVMADAFVLRGWIVTGGTGRLVLSDAGWSWYARTTIGENPHAAQHQMLTMRCIPDGKGGAEMVTVNEAESPIALLHARELIDGVQFDAGEKLRRDFTIAQLMPRMGVDLGTPITARQKGQRPQAPMADTVIAARQRVRNAMNAVGPGLSDVLIDVCCHLRKLGDVEDASDWPRGAAGVMLKLALDRLAMHYGMLNTTGPGRMRVWRAGEKAR